MPSAPPAGATSVGLPAAVRACLFDLDGVLTDTASVHARAWKEMFDDFLISWPGRHGLADGAGRPFDLAADYPRYVDGKRRADGTRSFLRSRGIELPEGDPDDPPRAETVNGLGNRKNDLVQARIATDGVTVYPGSVRYLQAVADAGLSVAVVSSSANTAQVLQVTGLAAAVQCRVDAQAALAAGLAGKPAPDTFLEGARRLGVPAGEAVVFEDALAGVAAGRAGGFAVVIGVDRVGHGEALRANGADVVVTDLDQLL